MVENFFLLRTCLEKYKCYKAKLSYEVEPLGTAIFPDDSGPTILK